MTTFSVLGDDVVIGNDSVLGTCINGKPIFVVPTPYLKTVSLILSQSQNPMASFFVTQIEYELDERKSNSRNHICVVGEIPKGRSGSGSLCADDTYYRLFAQVMSDILKFSMPCGENEFSTNTGYFSMIYRRSNQNFPFKFFLDIEVGPPGLIGTAKWFEEKKEFNNLHSAIIHIIDKYWKNP